MTTFRWWCAGATDPEIQTDDIASNNFSADPLFCDPMFDVLTLFNVSPCAPKEHPAGADCGLIGAFDVECTATPTVEITWGKMKQLYR